MHLSLCLYAPWNAGVGRTKRSKEPLQTLSRRPEVRKGELGSEKGELGSEKGELGSEKGELGSEKGESGSENGRVIYVYVRLEVSAFRTTVQAVEYIQVVQERCRTTSGRVFPEYAHPQMAGMPG